MRLTISVSLQETRVLPTAVYRRQSIRQKFHHLSTEKTVRNLDFEKLQKYVYRRVFRRYLPQKPWRAFVRNKIGNFTDGQFRR